MNWKIPHSKPFVSKEDSEAVFTQVKSGMHSLGEKTKEFEKAVADFVNINYAIATNSGTNALHLALLVLNIKKGDEVILPSYVCQSVLSAVNYIGAAPILADINQNFQEEGYNISVETIKPLITEKTRAIIIPHMFGHPVKIDKIKKFNIPMIEDCAHSLGATYGGKNIGSFGAISIFSFYATKIISTGQGGMILTSSRTLKEKLDDLMKYDKRVMYRTSYNYSMTDIQAALGLTQLKKLDFFLKRRREIARKFEKAFQGAKMRTPSLKEGSITTRYILTIEKDLEGVKAKLAEKGITSERPVFKPLHQYLSLPKEKFPNTEKAHNTALSIPLYPALTDEEVDYIIESVIGCFS